MRSLVTVLFITHAFSPNSDNDFESRLIFGEVTAYRVCQFFGPPCNVFHLHISWGTSPEMKVMKIFRRQRRLENVFKFNNRRLNVIGLSVRSDFCL